MKFNIIDRRNIAGFFAFYDEKTKIFEEGKVFEEDNEGTE